MSSRLETKMWQVARMLEGDGKQALNLLLVAMEHDPELPEEAKRYLRRRLIDYMTGRCKTLDDAFGLVGYKTNERRNDNLKGGIYVHVNRVRKQIKKEGPINGEKDAFQVVADHWGLSYAMTRDLYYLGKDWVESL